MNALHLLINDPNVSSIFAQALRQIALHRLAPVTEEDLDRRQDARREDQEEEAAARRADYDGSIRGTLRSARFGGES